MKTTPKTWVPVSQYDEREDKERGGPSGKYQRILFAIKRDPSPIRAYREGRLWFACKEDIEEFLSSPEEVAKSKSATPHTKNASHHLAAVDVAAAVASLASIDTTLDEIYRVLERLTAAVENIATQPKTPHQELMASIGTNGNGFHQ